MDKIINTLATDTDVTLKDAVRLERDRHVAFAFAAADLLIETTSEGRIVTVSGAAHSIVGRSSAELAGTPIENLVGLPGRTFVRQLFKRICAVGRIDPVQLDFERAGGDQIQVLLGGCALPHLPGRVFLSATVLPPMARRILPERDPASGLLVKEGLAAAALDASRADVAALRLLQLDGLTKSLRRLPAARAAAMMEEVGAVLLAQSSGGVAAGKLGEEAFGIISTASERDNRPDTTLLREIAEIFRGVGIADGHIEPLLAKLDLSGDGLSESDVSRAITYAINRFITTHGHNFHLKSLSGALAAMVDETVTRVAEIRRMIADGQFTLVFQPVVDIKTLQIHHYEALSRFPGKSSAFETISFSEEMELIPALDLEVCRRAVETLNRTPGSSVAINLSGRSIQSDVFRNSFGELIRPLNGLRGRLLFELTESAVVGDLEAAAAFLRWLRKLGHAVCLDDFGAGAAAYTYLRRFDVDFVKIDGPFLKSAMKHGREQALIRSIVNLAAEIQCSVIGEMIENEDMAAFATSLGISFGQGWLYGKPIPELPQPVAAGRRKGAVDSWG